MQISIISQNIDKGNVSSECQVLKNLILEHCKSKGTSDIGNIYEFLEQNHAIAIPLLIMVYKVALICSFSSATAEFLFSFMVYICTARRRCSTPFSKCARDGACPFDFFSKNFLPSGYESVDIYILKKFSYFALLYPFFSLLCCTCFVNLPVKSFSVFNVLQAKGQIFFSLPTSCTKCFTLPTSGQRQKLPP